MKATPRGRVMSDQEQLDGWLAGKPEHRQRETGTGGECCPDFSCCRPSLLQPYDVRQAFVAADERGRERFLFAFLGAMSADLDEPAKVHIAGQGEPT